MERLFFNVEKVKATSLMKQGIEPVSAINHSIVGKGKELHRCSEGYGLMPNKAIYDAFVEYFEQNKMPFTASGTNFRDVRFSMDFALTDHKVNIGDGQDPVFPSIRVLNSYNGTVKYTYSIRILRLICTNGMTAMVDEKVVRMLHTPQVEDGMAVEKSINLLEEFMEIYDDAVEPLEELADFPVRDVPKRIAEVVDAIGFPVGLAEFALARAEQEIRQFKLEPTDWLVYNALNYQLNHNADNLLGRKADRLDKAALDYLLTY